MTKIKQYSISDHVKNLERYLKETTEYHHLACPVVSKKLYKYHCKMCVTFLGIHHSKANDCPCRILGRKEAIRRTKYKIKLWYNPFLQEN